MSKLPDRAAAIATFFCETPPQMLGGGGVLTMESIQAELDRRFPGISFDIASFLRISVAEARRRVDEGDIPTHKIGDTIAATPTGLRR